VITFGAGGTMIELMNDRAMELPPLNQFLARRLIERARVAETLGEWRGAPAADMDALEQVLLRVSEMVCELPSCARWTSTPSSWTRPVRWRWTRASSSTCAAAHGGRLQPPGHPALPGAARAGVADARRRQYTIRPIHPDDADMLQAFVRGPVARRAATSALPARCRAAAAHAVALHADRLRPRDGAGGGAIPSAQAGEDGEITETERIVGVSRYITNPDQTSCEFSLVVADDFKGQGLGSRLMLSIMDVAREKGLSEIEGLVLANNPTCSS
jgi:acetyltransferase